RCAAGACASLAAHARRRSDLSAHEGGEMRRHSHRHDAGHTPGRTDAGKLKPKTKENRMAKNALASEDLAKKFASEKETPYTRWIKNEGLEIIPALYVRNLRTVELKPWARRGGNAV